MQAKNILVASDFSESSEAALQVATSLARHTAATLHIVHVREPNTMYRLDSRYGDVSPFPDLDMLKTTLGKILPGDADVPYKHWLLDSNDVSKEILNLAKQVDADFIVMGTHGRKGLTRLLMGSVAESIVRHAHCPVLTIKHPRPGILEPVTGRLTS